MFLSLLCVQAERLELALAARMCLTQGAFLCS